MTDLEYTKSILDRMKDLEFKASKEYQTVDGNGVPRVTEILSQMLHEDYLMNWANSLGFKRIGYRSYMNLAADKGTYSHLAIERFLKNREYPNLSSAYPDRVRPTVNSTFSAFLKWWKTLNSNNKVEVVFTEYKLIHPYFGGTCDCVLKINDEYWLIDFKTSNHMNYKYILQLAAYKFLLKELKDISISGCCVLLLDKENSEYNDYVLNLHNKDHSDYMDQCMETFFLLAAAYRMRLYTKSEYDRIFKNTK